MLIPINTARLNGHAFKSGRTIESKIIISTTDNVKKNTDSLQEKKANTQANNKLNKELTDKKYFRANLLNQIVNKMSGHETVTLRGQYVEYFA